MCIIFFFPAALCDRSNVGPLGLEGPSSRWGDHDDGGYLIYKKLFYYVLTPIIGGMMCWIYFFPSEFDRSWMGRYTPYEHMYRHTKNWPWGNGKKSLFHNPKFNAVHGEGYEDDPKC